MPDIEVVVLYPELLGLYADRGNALALEHRAAIHGLEVHTVEISPDDPVPSSADLYLLGGAEDAAMTVSLSLLKGEHGFARAVNRGAQVLAVCAGFQILGRTLVGPGGEELVGLGHLDVASDHLPHARAVGEILVDSPFAGELQGFENHRGSTALGPAASRLGTVKTGVGNGYGHAEGAVQDNLIGTYLHGPVLARNPALADLLLSRITGTTLPPVRDPMVEELRAERRRDLSGARHWFRRLRSR